MNESAIFKAAVKLSPEQRPNFLEAACGGDPRLQEEVDALLREHDGIGSFISRPAVLASPTEFFRPLTESPGTLIGRYKLLEQIGEGGMGVVFVAEQTEPVHRRVALKVIKPGMDTKQVIARFEAERQALALMDHQNIARVLDAGTTDTGRPYFVMELVKGIPITDYCDANRLSPRERLELFVPVCRAIQHAHQKGVIHRDIKPSNVLVALHDGVPVPKVIDFGVAKATDQRLTERTMFTQHGAVLGTLEYMSPEQAENSALDVDTRSDVYALGVLLYELLTGGTPLERATLREAGYAEILKRIKEEEPPRPSTRLSASRAALALLSAQRKTEPSKLAGLVRGELDWIVMKALEKDRSRRYETAVGFARDVERYLKDEAVEACPPSTLYRFRKFARKHKPALATAVAIAASLILGTTASAWQAVRATTAEAQANANATQAQEKAEEATTQRDEAQRQRDEVKALNDKLAAKEQQLQQHLYASNMNLAKHSWDAGTIARVEELLDQHRPKQGEPDRRGFEWHYLHRLCHRELLTLRKGNFGTDAGGVAFSPDGNRIASGNHGIKVWDAQTGQELLSLKTGVNWNVAFSPNGQRLASVSNQWDSAKNRYVAHEVKVWDPQTGQEVLSFPVEGITGNGCVWWVAYSPDGKHLATSSGEWANPPKPGEIKIWDAQTGQELQILKGQEGAILRLAYSPDGRRLASVGADTVKVWDTLTGEALLTFGAMNYSAAFSPDGTRLAGTSWSRATGSALTVWNAQSGQGHLSLKGEAMSVAFSPDGKRLASGKRDGEVLVLDAETGQELLSFKGHTDQVSGLAFSPNGTRLASSSNDGTVKVWDATASLDARTVSGTTGNIRSVTFSPDGKRLAGVVRDPKTGPITTGDEVKVWDAQTGQELLTVKEHAGRVVRVVYSPDGKRLASAGGIWDGKTARYVAGEVKVWDAQTGREIVTFKAHTSAVVSVVFSPDGTRAASCSSRPGGRGNEDPPGEVKVWDAETGQEILALQGHKQFVDSVTYSPDGKRLATLSRDNTVKVWDAQTGAEILSLNVRTFFTGSVAFSPDGKRLASSNNASASGSGHALGEVKIWDAQTGQELLSFKGHNGQIRSVAFSPDGKRLVSGTGNPYQPTDGALKVWDAETGYELLTLKGGGYHDGISFSPDGYRLASDVGGKVTIWDATPLPEKP